jgi:hypothetical protein
MLYDNANDCDATLKSLKSHTSSSSQSSSRQVDQVDGVSRNNSSGDTFFGRIAHNMATRFKVANKFSGKLDGNLTEYLNNYMDACNDYNLSVQHRFDYKHHLLEGEAKRFFRANVISSCMSYSEASSLMQNEFNGITRQNRVRKHLQKLRLGEVMSRNKCSVAEGLEEIHEVITKLTPQVPKAQG